jgi:two-component system sensor histidine kinase DctS
MAHHARLTMLGEIASTLAHELNQPLSAISSYNAGVMNSLQRADAAAANALTDSATTTDPAVLRALQRLGEQAAHAGRIVQRIRQFLTRREPQLESCSLNAVLEGGVALLARELARQHVQLTLTLEANLPLVVADAVLIEQVIINLVRNASDALAEVPEHDANTDATATRRERRIEARTMRTQDQRFVRIDVRDNGPGLQGRRIEALCAPFYSTKVEGMGMGLAICRSILEAHQGVLDAVEAPGGGAWFSLTLPIDLPVTASAVEESEVV